MTAFAFYLDKRTRVGQLKPFYKQTIYGVIFAISAIFATELGSIYIYGSVVNCRDASIVIAGLIFGPWAGIFSGIWAAAERYFIATAIFNVGGYTQTACTIATIFAGFFSALFYVLIFRKHRPFIIHAVVFIIVTEVVHMILIPLTNWYDIETANMIMVNIFAPILFSNIVAAALSVLCTTIMDIKFKGYRLRDAFKLRDLFFTQDLFYSFQFWLLLVIIVAFAVNIFVISLLYSYMSLEISSNKYEGELRIMRELIYKDKDLMPDKSTSEIACTYAKEWTSEKVICFDVADEEGNILSANSKLTNVAKDIISKPELQMYRIELGGDDVFTMYISIGNTKLISYSFEKYEMFLPYFTTSMTTFIQIVVFGMLMYAVFILLKLLVGNNLAKINRSLGQITQGNLEEQVDVYSHREFAVLSDSINATVNTLKKYIQEEADRYKEEFEMAKQIQLSALPNVFPPFPNDPEIDFYAKYKPAKIIGGDFYDYYYVSKNRLAFLIADVSGKGVPAAMFMMRAKTAFRVFSDKKNNAADVLEAVNNYLCENNEAEMFVTAWFGVADIENGRIEYASAGHNAPYAIHPTEGDVKKLDAKPALVLGAMPDISYTNNYYVCKPNEKVLLFTDGIVEAHNVNNELFGEDKLIETIKKHRARDVRDICEHVSFEVDEFSAGQEQFDDYSLLCFIYKGADEASPVKKDYWESEITVFSKIDSVSKVIERCEETCKFSNAPDEFTYMFDVCIDEIFSNIVKFSYKRSNEYISVRIIVDERGERNFVQLTFVDTGPRFNPLDQESPDITLSAEDREIGGLGIFMVREMVDEMSYEYKSLANWLTITKYYD